jgi:hypothetical protein
MSLRIQRNEWEPSIVSGTERMTYPSFFKKYNIFRNSQIDNVGKPVLDSIEFPYNSVFHLLDNFDNKNKGYPISDIPNLNVPFIANDKIRKYIYHVTEPMVVGEDLPIQLPHDYLFRSLQLRQNITKFRTKNNTKFKHVASLENLPKEPSALTIINHNPLFRTRVRGILPTFRAFNVIFGSILNIASKIENKEQFIFIPLANEMYRKTQLILAEKALNVNTLRAKDSFHYLFMVNWFNFLSSTSHGMSLLEKYPESKWNTTTFVLYYGNYALFYKLTDVLNLNINNQAYNRMLNQFNKLIVTGMSAAMGNADELITSIGNEPKTDVNTPEKQKELDDIEEQHIEEVFNKLTNNKTIKDNIRKEETTTVEKENDNNDIITEKSNVVEPLNEDNFDIPEFEDVDIFETPRQEDIEHIFGAAPKIPLKDVLKPVLNEGVITRDDKDNYESVSTTIEEDNKAGLIEKPKPFLTGEAVALSGKAFVEELETEVNTFISKDATLTVKQKERAKRLAMQYKNISINNKTIHEILTEPTDPTISDSKVESLDGYVPDKSMLKSSITDFDTLYMDKFFYKDLVASAISFNKYGMFLTDISEETKIDQINRIREFKLSYEDINGKHHTVKFTIPYVNEDGTCLVNGVRSYFKKQMINLPICKISETRVSLASNYNKTIVERNVAKAHSFISYLQKIINFANEQTQQIQVQYGTTTLGEIRVGYEYSATARLYKSLSFKSNDNAGTITFCFDYKNRFENIPENVRDKLLHLEKTYGVYLGKKEGKDNLIYFMSPSSVINAVDFSEEKLIGRSNLITILMNKFNVQLSSRLTEWTDIKILDKKFPIGFLLCYKMGLKNTLSHLKARSIIYPTRSRYLTNPTDIIIKFKDKDLVIPRYPLKVSLILAGLTMFETKNYLMEDFETPDIYYQLLIDAGYKINYLKGIDDTFTLFIDPMTRNRLIQMGEPTNFGDLLIRATDMLTVEAHKEAASMSNHSFRGYERLNAILYNEMARSYSNYARKKGAGSVFSINPNAVFQRILQDQAMMNVDEINPIHGIKTTTGFTYTGVGGRTQEAFTIPDRRYPKDAIGMISEATPDSGNVAIAATTSMNPKLYNIYGFINTDSSEEYLEKEVEPTNMLSVASLLMPAATQDDCD